ncbi:MAG: hypothetical protein AB1578_02180 [Thermodesulfobacteriota bacterium]
MRTRLLALALFVPLAAVPFEAAAAVSCHCFRDRSFDPLRPAAADPYVLATAQNSVLAAVFGLEKKSVVQAKMTGAANEDLWLAHFAAARTGLRPAELLDARARAGTWGEALGSLGVAPERLGGAFPDFLERNGADALLASAVVDAVAAERLAAVPAELEALRAAGASDAETVAGALLFRLTGTPPVQTLAAVRKGSATWGGLFHAAGLEPAAIGDAAARLLRPPP